MRIIAGKHRGRILHTVNDLSVRPATDRVKSAIFNSLQSRIDWNGATVLDLFAGSGSIGLEALSRGAKNITFVESSSPVLEFLKNNILNLNEEVNCNIIPISVEQYLSSSHSPFSIVFADPPYEDSELPQLPQKIFFSNLVEQDGLLVIEHPVKLKFDLTDEIRCVRNSNYGRTAVSFFQFERSTK